MRNGLNPEGIHQHSDTVFGKPSSDCQTWTGQEELVLAAADARVVETIQVAANAQRRGPFMRERENRF